MAIGAALLPADAPRARRLVVASVVFFVVTHVVALATMALVLRPGMDPSAFTPAERMAFVAASPWAWRLGWLPWQLSALSDVAVCLSLWAWARRRADLTAVRWALAALALDLVSAIPEQWAEAMLVTSFVTDAGGADLAAWSRDWALYAAVTGVWANGGYTLMTGAWMMIARRLLGGSVAPWPLEVTLLALFTLSGALTLLSTLASGDAIGTWFMAASAVNGIAFPALTLWMIVLAVRARRGETR
jgi:hypothetical protein